METITPPASLRIVFAGTSSFAVPVLQAIFEEGYRVAGVVTRPDKPAGRGRALQAPPVKAKALELGIPVHQPKSIKDDAARALFAELAPEMLVVVAYGKLLPGWLLDLPRCGAVNLHGSLLPLYRGAAPIAWAIANGESETGVCTMKIDEGLDTGPVYACEKTPIHPDESRDELSDRLATLGAGLMKRTISGVVAGTLHPVPQDHSRASHAPILTREHGVLDWNMPARAIHDRVRAFRPWPGTSAEFRGNTCRILRSRVGERVEGRVEPGTVSIGQGSGRSPAVACGDGVLLELVELQFPNRKAQSGADFVNGMRVRDGEKFAVRPRADG